MMFEPFLQIGNENPKLLSYPPSTLMRISPLTGGFSSLTS